MNLQFDKPIMIFKNQTKQGTTYYTTSISQKNMNGEYENASMFIRFKGNPDIENQSLMIINQASLKFNKKDKQTTFYIMVWDYEPAIKKVEVKKDIYEDFGNSFTVEDLDKQMELPF